MRLYIRKHLEEFYLKLIRWNNEKLDSDTFYKYDM